MELGLAVLTFAIVVLVLFLVFGLAGGGRKNVIGRRLEAIDRGVGRGDGTQSPQLKLLRDEVMSSMPKFNRYLLSAAWAGRLRRFTAQAGLNILPGKLILWSGVLGLGLFVILPYFYPNQIVAAVVALLGAAAPWAYVAFKRSSRLRSIHQF